MGVAMSATKTHTHMHTYTRTHTHMLHPHIRKVLSKLPSKESGAP